MDTLSHEHRLFSPPQSLKNRAWIRDFKTYETLYRRSLEDPEGFWAEQAQSFEWFRKWDRVLSYDWAKKIDVKWFEGAKTNITVNALDRHLKKNKDKTSFLWVGNEPGEEKTITYADLFQQVSHFANALKSLGVKKGDRVMIYLPMIPELPVAMLACARIGAIHSVVFGGFSADSLKTRVLDCKSRVLITSDGAYRGSKKIPMKETADQAIQQCLKEKHVVEHCVVVRRTGDSVSFDSNRDQWWEDVLSKTSSRECLPEEMDAEDPLFILYTSGSTGKPKGALHTTAGYMVHTALTFRYIFDYHPEDIYWCTADIGWITGHSYIVYGPLCNAATSVLFEGIPTYPRSDRFWEVIEKHKVNIFYTAPTAIRSLMKEGEELPAKHDLSSLKILGSVGEPINPEAWMWYHKNIGHEKCPIVDTWWQTETGGILLSPLPGAVSTKPGSATVPFFGVEPAILKEDGAPCEKNEGGYLVIKRPWPGIMRTVYGHHERFRETYFSKFPGVYFTGDGARQDEDGYYWVTGRIDDVLKVSGHRIGTAEVESALVSHPSVAEAAVVGYPHDVKGEGIYAFVTLKTNGASNENELKIHVRKEIGPIAVPDKIQFAEALPKTRSGKIMRRILRKIAAGKPEEVGDTSTLADASVVENLIKGKL